MIFLAFPFLGQRTSQFPFPQVNFTPTGNIIGHSFSIAGGNFAIPAFFLFLIASETAAGCFNGWGAFFPQGVSIFSGMSFRSVSHSCNQAYHSHGSVGGREVKEREGLPSVRAICDLISVTVTLVAIQSVLRCSS